MEKKFSCIWFTGLSGSGKSTLTKGIQQRLKKDGIKTIILDGDVIRKGLNNDLGFTIKDREENIRRISEMAKVLINEGIVTICAVISPTHKIRSLAKQIIGATQFYEIFVDTPFEICKKRDVKGLYKKAEFGEIMDFTGLSSPYERPGKSNLIVTTDDKSVDYCIELIYDSYKNMFVNE